MTAWVLGGDDGLSCLVTQTDDVETAKRALLADPVIAGELADEWENLTYDDPSQWLTDTDERAAAWLDRANATVEHGRFICTAWALAEGYRQAWRGWPAEGRERATGETTAVRFMAPPYEGPAG